MAVHRRPLDDTTTTLTVSFDCPALGDPASAYRKNDRFEAIDSGARETLHRIKLTAETHEGAAGTQSGAGRAG